MNHACPSCGNDLSGRRLSQAIVARMEIDCSFCKRMLRANVHRAEAAVLLASFGAFVGFGLAAYWLEREVFVVCALAAAMAGAGLLPVVERVWLRRWPRYVIASGSPPS